MPKLSPQTVTLLDGDLRLFKRDRSRAWQATFKIDGRWVRISTKHKQLDAAKKRARELYVEYQVRLKNGLPVISKRFADVAAVAIAEMDKQLEAGAGKKSYRDYRIVLEKYFIPYFGDRFITSITYEDLQQFAKWREHKMGHEPRASTLNTHNSALNRVFDEAVARGYMNRTHVPVLINKGRDSERRPDFRREEYRKMIATLPSWIDRGRDGKSRDMRHLLRDYILILANTGIRHGTEALNLRWKHIHLFKEDGLSYLEMHVNGKTGPRDLMCRIGVINYLKRIQSRSPDIADMTFEELLQAQVDKPVFRLPDGTVTKNLRQTFRLLMEDTGLLKCPRTGQSRTLYSFRHTYATFALLNDGMDVHTLAIQMGTSIQMIERHYSHLTPRLRKDMLTGKRHDLPADEFRKRYNIQSHAVSQKDMGDVDPGAVIEAELPEEPVAEESGDPQSAVAVQSQSEFVDETQPTAAERAFGLFDAGKIGELALLAAVGVSRDGYVPSETITHRALDAVEQDKLSEEALIKIIG
jgi:integrase